MKKGLVLIAAGLLLVGFSLYQRQNRLEREPERSADVTVLRAEDGTEIAAKTFLVQDSKAGVVIAHNEGGSRRDVEEYARQLAQATGASTIAIDLRGHGESQGDYQKFTNDDWGKLLLDYQVAEKYLLLKGAEKVAFVGFGVSANAAAIAAERSKAAALVIVSPVLDSHGLKPEEAVKAFQGPLLVSAAQDDTLANNAASRLYELSRVTDKQFVEYKAGGHGTQLLHTDLPQIMADWLKRMLATN